MSVAGDIWKLLVVGRYPDTTFVGIEPQKEVNCITIYDTGGPMQNAKFALDDLNFQVRSRHSLYKDGMIALETAKLQLDGIGEFIAMDEDGLPAYKYLGIWCMTAPMFIGRDAEQRPLFTANFRTMREPLTDSLRGAKTALSNSA